MSSSFPRNGPRRRAEGGEVMTAILTEWQLAEELDKLGLRFNSGTMRVITRVLNHDGALRSEVERLREERELVKRWLRNMPDAADLEDARKKAEEIADRIEQLDRGTPAPVTAPAPRYDRATVEACIKAVERELAHKGMMIVVSHAKEAAVAAIRSILTADPPTEPTEEEVERVGHAIDDAEGESIARGDDDRSRRRCMGRAAIAAMRGGGR